MTQSSSGPDEYAEALHAPLSWWLATIGFAVVVWWVFVLATPMAFAIGAAVVALVAVGIPLQRYGSARVTVADGVVSAGPARIDVVHCGDALALDAARTAAVRGREADARAHLALRPYIATSVKLDIRDENDPTPYWLVSTRNPQRLADAITAARRSTTDND